MRDLVSIGLAGLTLAPVPGALAQLRPFAAADGQAPAREAPETSEAPLVDRVEIQNNQYLQRDTLLFYISTKAGDRYDERRLRDDFRRLWDTGFLDDLILDVRDSPTGKVVMFRVVER
ncbi:MAG TPA: POTRA domain-containing protein, partial [Vicinamibacteria bacterium]